MKIETLARDSIFGAYDVAFVEIVGFVFLFLLKFSPFMFIC